MAKPMQNPWRPTRKSRWLDASPLPQAKPDSQHLSASSRALLSAVTSPQLANDQTACRGAEHKLFDICASGSGLCKMNESAKVICRSEGAKTGCQTAGHSDLSLPITLIGLGSV